MMAMVAADKMHSTITFSTPDHRPATAIPSYDSCIYPLQTLAAYPDGARVSELQDRDC